MEIKVPYGKGEQSFTPKESYEVLIPSSHDGIHPTYEEEDKIVIDAIASPIDSKPLSMLAVGKKKCVIICSDHTRPVPSKHIIPFMLKEIRKNNPDIEIVLLIATGCHRETTRDELIAKFGEDIVLKEKIVVHDCEKSETHEKIGILPSGAELIINKEAASCDLLVSEGFIEPHFFAGYSGGRKSVLPGICAKKTVCGNHCSAFIADENSTTGVLAGNPIHKDMEAAAKMADLQFIVNVIINSDKQVIAAVAGDPITAHSRGCEIIKDKCRVTPKKRGDIVISTNGGSPLDQNIYQSVKGMTAAESAAAEGATIIMVSECIDGHGGEQLYLDVKNAESMESLFNRLLTVSQDSTAPDQWITQILARIARKYEVILVCCEKAQPLAHDMKLKTASSLKEAYEYALTKHKEPHTVIIPDGISVVVEKI